MNSSDLSFRRTIGGYFKRGTFGTGTLSSLFITLGKLAPPFLVRLRFHDFFKDFFKDLFKDFFHDFLEDLKSFI
jgi:hypothetical protein